jgi:hypothetical protein
MFSISWAALAWFMWTGERRSPHFRKAPTSCTPYPPRAPYTIGVPGVGDLNRRRYGPPISTFPQGTYTISSYSDLHRRAPGRYKPHPFASVSLPCPGRVITKAAQAATMFSVLTPIPEGGRRGSCSLPASAWWRINPAVTVALPLDTMCRDCGALTVTVYTSSVPAPDEAGHCGGARGPRVAGTCLFKLLQLQSARGSHVHEECLSLICQPQCYIKHSVW